MTSQPQIKIHDPHTYPETGDGENCQDSTVAGRVQSLFIVLATTWLRDGSRRALAHFIAGGMPVSASRWTRLPFDRPHFRYGDTGLTECSVGSSCVLSLRLLGPMEAWGGSQKINLGPRKQRLVLAILALEVNRPVEVSRLVDLLWPENVPRTAAHAVRVCVSALRSVFACLNDVEIQTKGSGMRWSPTR
jgi:Transcriptional regulatory protein, C terminal